MSNRQPRWTRAYFIDLAERVGATLIGALLALLAANQVTDLTPELAWTIIGVPTLTSLLKGLAANMASPESGASLAPAPPGPVIEEEHGDHLGGLQGRHRRDEAGESGLVLVLAVVGVVLLVLLLVGVLR